MSTLIQDRQVTKPRVLKRVNPLSIGSESFEEGDYCFKISNFDDYVYFALTEFNNGIETPLDLTTFGDIFLKFTSKGNNIMVPSVPNLQNIESAKGEVVFKINKADSDSVIKFPGNNFSIVSKMQKGDDSSFESVLFEGLFLKPNDDQKIAARFNSIYNQSVDNSLEALKIAYENNLKQVDSKKKTIDAQRDLYDKSLAKEATLSKQFQALQSALFAKNDSVFVAVQPTPNTGVSGAGDVSNTGLENLGTNVNLPTGGGGRPAPISNTDADTILRAGTQPTGGEV